MSRRCGSALPRPARRHVRARFSSEPGIDFVAKRLGASRPPAGGMSNDAEGDAARDRFVALLDEASGASRHDRILVARRRRGGRDACARPELLALGEPPRAAAGARRHPEGCDAGACRAARVEPRVAVLQHGWQHKNHAARGREEDRARRKASALGCASTSFAAAAIGSARCSRDPSPSSCRPGTASPKMCARRWTRSDFRASRPSARHRQTSRIRSTRISTFSSGARCAGRSPAPRPMRGSLPKSSGGLTAMPEPIGILTHHLVHEEASWALLDELFAMTARHPAARWPEIKELFGL